MILTAATQSFFQDAPLPKFQDKPTWMGHHVMRRTGKVHYGLTYSTKFIAELLQWTLNIKVKWYPLPWWGSVPDTGLEWGREIYIDTQYTQPHIAQECGGYWRNPLHPYQLDPSVLHYEVLLILKSILTPRMGSHMTHAQRYLKVKFYAHLVFVLIVQLQNIANVLLFLSNRSINKIKYLIYVLFMVVYTASVVMG